VNDLGEFAGPPSEAATPEPGGPAERDEPGQPGHPRRAVRWLTSRTTPSWRRTNERLGRTPLRVRLVAILAALVLVALAISGVASVAIVRNLLMRQVDTQLSRTVTTISHSPLERYFTTPGTTPPQGTPREPTTFLGLLYLPGFTPAAEPLGQMTADHPPTFPRLTYAQATAHGRAPFTVQATDGGEHWRMTVLPVSVADIGQQGSLVIAIPLTGVEGPVHTLWLIEIGVGLAVLLAVSGLGFVVVRRSLRPLREVETVAGAIAAGDLSQRVPERPATTEVGSLSRSLNGMLAQIEYAFGVRAASEARMRQFVADASHELRTPLAAVRGYAELYRQGAVSEPEDVASAMRRIEDEAARLGLLVEDLLLLARLDEERETRADPVDLTVLAADAVQDARALAPDRPITLLGLNGALAPTEVAGDERRLRQVITNLVANAINHTPPSTPIEIAVGPSDPPSGGVAVEVRDHGPGVDPEQARRVFERFFRADPSRQRGRGGGTGLGLAIVAAIVAAHDGRVGVTQTRGGGATFVVELPGLTAPARPVAKEPVTEVLPANSQS
jgi:two-component system OmpR family sensor kinase